MPGFIPVSIAIVLRKSPSGMEAFFQKRKEEGPLDGLLEFPGGKIESGESPEECAFREFGEEVGVRLEKSAAYDRLGPYKYDYSDRSVCLYAVLMRQDDIKINSGFWLGLPDVFSASEWSEKVPEANLEILKDLISHVRNYEFN